MLKAHWQELSDNFYNNYMKIKLFFYMIEYVKATGDYDSLELLYGNDGNTI